MAGGRGHSFDELALQVWTARPDGHLDFVNACTVAYFAVSPERLLEDGWKDVCHSLDLISAGQRWRQCLASGEDYEVQFRLLHGGDRGYRWHLARAVAMRDEAGNITGWVGTNTDVDRLVRELELAQAEAARR